MATAKDKLAALRAQYTAPTKSAENTGGGQFNNYYPFWNMKSGQRAVVRFLADTNDSNPHGFLVEKSTHTLQVNGKPKQVPCLSMYGQECPVCKISQAFYKADDKLNGKKYWRKKQYIAQALIVDDPLPADEKTGETHAGKVRYLSLGYQIYNVIKEAFASTDDPLEGIPYDFEDGYDFFIKRTDAGQYPSYTSGTKFHSKQRSLTEEEVVAANEGMVDLSTLLPQNPGYEKVNSFLEADMNGGTAEDEDEGAPAPAPARNSRASDPDDDMPYTPPARQAPAPKPTPAPAADDEDGDVNDMLATIRARRGR